MAVVDSVPRLRPVLLTVLALLPFLAGRATRVLVLAGVWVAAAFREGYERAG